MQVGSLVECIKDFGEHPVAILMKITGFNVTLPIVGHKYIVTEMQRCVCGKHENLKLNSISGYWDERYFRELEPPINLDKILENVSQEHLEEVY